MLGSVNGSSYPPISHAVEVFKEKVGSIEHYEMELFRDGPSQVVLFTDEDKNAPGIRGNPGKRPAFEVELDPSDFRILRSNFVR